MSGIIVGESICGKRSECSSRMRGPSTSLCGDRVRKGRRAAIANGEGR